MLILASASSRRADMLHSVGLEFVVRPVRVDETFPGAIAPEAGVLAVAARKALTAWRTGALAGGDVVLAADTVIALEGRVLGKPRDAQDAREMLSALSGRAHRVLTAVVVRGAGGKGANDVVTTDVVFRPLDRSEVDAYVATGEPLDKAGAYAIQGGARTFVTDVRGDRENVIGLPLRRTLELLAEAGYAVPAGAWARVAP